MGIESYFNYCPETGIVTWSADAKGARCKTGAPVGTKDKNGYLTVKVCGTTWKVHRLIFLLMGVSIPTTVDHINGVPDDNRWANLRGCSPLGNAHNRKAHRNNTTGYKGVTLDRGVIRAQITVKGKHFSKGGFSTIQKQLLGYNKMAATHHGEFARSI